MRKFLNSLKKICSFNNVILCLFLLLVVPLNVLALSDEYDDKVATITGSEVVKDKINLYLFRGEGCPHCAKEEEWLEEIQEDYKDYLIIYEFEVWHDDDNALLMEKVKDKFKITSNGVPFTVVGDVSFSGFSDTTASKIENAIREYAELDIVANDVTLPFFGSINMSEVSIPIVAVILGGIDGFNPCAMWILLFLINMFLGTKNKRKSWILGFTFLFVSSFIYFLSMLGINFVLGVATISYLKVAIALFILVAGIFNFRKYFKMRKEENGCSVVNNKKRKKIIVRIRKIMDSNSFILSLFGIIFLAVSVNLIELACSLGFPMIFTEILSINEITGVMKFVYLFIYIFFYMIDDIVVFTISMITLQATGITNKYNKLCTLVSAVIMIVMGLLLLLKPEWLMLNF